MPYRPEKRERESKLRKRLEVMPDVYEKVGIPTISEKVEKIMAPTEMLTEIYSILDEEGIIAQDRIKYLNFARIIFRLKQRYKDRALRDQAERELRAYMERRPGLVESVLRRIMDKVLAYPTAPTAGAGVVRGT
jgi:hypothetical protein